MELSKGKPAVEGSSFCSRNRYVDVYYIRVIDGVIRHAARASPPTGGEAPGPLAGRAGPPPRWGWSILRY